MKIKCDKNSLVRGLQAVSKAVSVKNTIYALSGILLTAKENELIFSATDIEMAIEYREQDVTIEEEGSLIVPGRYMLEISKKLPETEIELETEGYTLFVRYGNSEITVNGLDKDEFPDFPVVDGIIKGEFRLFRFEEDIREVSIAVGTDESRPLFTGILFEFNGGEVNLVATDTHRLATKKSVWNSEGEGNSASVIVPNKVLQEIIRLEADDDTVIEVIVGKKEICFACDNRTYISRLIEGKFPNYHQVIPAEEKVKATAEVDVSYLLSTLERAFILSKELVKEHVGRINISLINDSLTVESRSPEMGHIHEEIAVAQQGEDISLIFNARYLLDVLRIIDSETAVLKFTGKASPLVIERNDRSGYIYLALPLKG